MKRIIVACDGTGRSDTRLGGENSIPSNVGRFCHALSNTGNVQQIIFYQSGVGTQDLGVAKGLGKLVQGALGEGLEDHVADGYHFIMNNFKLGDEIFLFGFSRGAFTARVIANIVGRLGIIVRADAWALKAAMQAHQDGTLDSYAACCSTIEERGEEGGWKDYPRVFRGVEIQIVGCWDTVASLGIPFNPFSNAGGVTGRYKHFDGGLVKGIKHAFHALSLDECRGPFTPTLWHLPEDDLGDIVLHQCWFPGAHTNVGGGYPDRALSNITLAWMVDRCSGFLDFNQEYLCQIALFDRKPLRWHEHRPDSTKKHKGGFDTEYQGWARGMWYDSYKEGDTWTWKYRTPGGYKVGGQTQETMHASVRERWESSREKGLTTGPPVWSPEALKGFQPREVSGKWEWVKKGCDGQDHLVLPEFSFPTEEASAADLDDIRSFEGMLRYGDTHFHDIYRIPLAPYIFGKGSRDT